MTLIIGANGSMGQRYQAIFRYLELDFLPVDIETSEKEILKKADLADRTILCTPTETHFSFLKKLLPMQKPVLCEKPISKSLREMEKIIAGVKSHDVEFSMTFQYSELVGKHQGDGPSYYNYFRTGKDGLIWDCLQIIALACGEPELKNSSPVWQCMINGLKLNLSDMDLAYVNFVRKWCLGLIRQNPDVLFDIHEKVERIQHGRPRNKA